MDQIDNDRATPGSAQFILAQLSMSGVGGNSRHDEDDPLIMIRGVGEDECIWYIAHCNKYFRRGGSEDGLVWKRLKENNIDEAMKGRYEDWDEVSNTGDES